MGNRNDHLPWLSGSMPHLKGDQIRKDLILIHYQYKSFYIDIQSHIFTLLKIFDSHNNCIKKEYL